MLVSAQQEPRLLAASWRAILHERRYLDAPWLITPHDPVHSDAADRLSFADLARESERIGKTLVGLGGQEGDRVLLGFDNGPSFCLSYFAVVQAGMVPVPFPPAYVLPSIKAYRERLTRVLEHATPRFVLIDDDTARRVGAEVLAGRHVLSFEALTAAGSPAKDLPATAPIDELGLLQYTSGTTGLPRAVELTHRNVLSNVHGILEGVGGRQLGDVAFTWLPMFHDMGLIGTLLMSTYAGVPLVMMTPRQFIMRPESWLWAMSRFHAVGCAAPSFAYQLCTTRIRHEQLNGLDLGAWRIALNGSESVQAQTVADFSARFGAFGFRAEAMTPVYGLAENTVGCTFDRPSSEPRFDAFSSARSVASVGTPLAGQRVRVVNAHKQEQLNRMVGEIEVGGPCVMRGYHRDARATRAALTADGWLRTGDRGYIADEQLFVVGRSKDVIKRAGQGYDAADVIRASASAPGCSGFVAAFGVPNVRTGSEDLVVMVEAAPADGAALEQLRSGIRRSVYEALGVQPDAIRLVGPSEIPRTTSGKVSNAGARDLYLASTIEQP